MPIVYRPGLTNSDISKIEQVLKKKLPTDYKTFLSNKNGFFISDPDFSEISTDKISDGVISFDRLFGLNENEGCNDLLSFNGEFISELNHLSGAIAIGEDGGGNPYVLLTEGKNSGVYYWDRTHLHEGDPINKFDIKEVGDSGNLFLISNSFKDFYKLIEVSLGQNIRYEETQ